MMGSVLCQQLDHVNGVLLSHVFFILLFSACANVVMAAWYFSNGHMMTHREKKPYQCQMEGCEKSYCDARSLRRHLEANHHQSPEAIANSVQASMAAAGIPTTTPGKPRPAEKLAVQEAVSRMQMGGSPSYSANTTPSPSPSYTSPNPQGQIFQFETQSGLPTTVVSTQQATPPQDQSWQERARVYDFVGKV